MRFALITLLTVITLPNLANADELASVQNHEMANVLANFDVLAETKFPESKGMYVRVIKVQDQGECGGSLETCPQSILYIAVSSYDEAPDQKVFQTPNGYNWMFDGWDKLPKTDKPTDYVQLRLSAQKPARSPSNTWQDEHYLYKVNYHDGSSLKR